MHKVTFILLVIGGLNWLIFGLFEWEVGMLFAPEGGAMGLIARIIYILVGLSALYEIFTHKANCRQCVSKTAMGGAPASTPSSM